MVKYKNNRFEIKINNKNKNLIPKLIDSLSNYEYIKDNKTIYIPPTKNNAKIILNCGFGFDKSAEMFKPRQINIPDSLFDYQKEGVLKALDMKTNILLADEMGLGKTPQASVYLSVKENALPALIICPASLKQNWKRELKKWGNIDAYIIDGKKPYPLLSSDLNKHQAFIINYDILGFEDKLEKEKENERLKIAKSKNYKTRKKILNVYGWCDTLIRVGFNTIVADEVQYISECDTIRTRAVKKICDALPKSKRLFISGTPYETKTSQFYSVLNMLDKKTFSGKYHFLYRYCNPKRTHFGWKFDGLSNSEELHSLISRIMIRRFKKDVLKQLPPKRRCVISLDISESDRKIYDDVDKQFELDLKSGVKTNKDLLGHISHLRQGAVKAKMNSIKTWIKDYLDSGNKLVVFIYHHETYDILMKEFGKISVGITGETPSKKRQLVVDKFQNDDKIRLFIGQIKASGVGLTLTKAPDTCFVEWGDTWVQHEQAEDRVHRIGQEADSVMAYYLVLNDSIEEDIMSTLEEHNADIKAVMNDTVETIWNDDDFKQKVMNKYKNRKKFNLFDSFFNT